MLEIIALFAASFANPAYSLVGQFNDGDGAGNELRGSLFLGRYELLDCLGEAKFSPDRRTRVKDGVDGLMRAQFEYSNRAISTWAITAAQLGRPTNRELGDIQISVAIASNYDIGCDLILWGFRERSTAQDTGIFPTNAAIERINRTGKPDVAGQSLASELSNVKRSLGFIDKARRREHEMFGDQDFTSVPRFRSIDPADLGIAADVNSAWGIDGKNGRGITAGKQKKKRGDGNAPHVFFVHRAFAAFAAIWERFLGPNAAALAVPPLSPPRRPNATAWRFLDGSMGFGCLGSNFAACSVDSSMIW